MAIREVKRRCITVGSSAFKNREVAWHPDVTSGPNIAGGHARFHFASSSALVVAAAMLYAAGAHAVNRLSETVIAFAQADVASMIEPLFRGFTVDRRAWRSSIARQKSSLYLAVVE